MAGFSGVDLRSAGIPNRVLQSISGERLAIDSDDCHARGQARVERWTVPQYVPNAARLGAGFRFDRHAE